MKIRAHFSASLMSNAKWRKFFYVVAEMPELVFFAKLKLIDQKEQEERGLPQSEDIFEDAVDTSSGPVDYRRIEWIEFPRRVPYRRYENAPPIYNIQDLESLQRELNKVGHFPIDEVEDGIRINGYRRKTT